MGSPKGWLLLTSNSHKTTLIGSCCVKTRGGTNERKSLARRAKLLISEECGYYRIRQKKQRAEKWEKDEE